MTGIVVENTSITMRDDDFLAVASTAAYLDAFPCVNMLHLSILVSLGVMVVTDKVELENTTAL